MDGMHRKENVMRVKNAYAYNTLVLETAGDDMTANGGGGRANMLRERVDG